MAHANGSFQKREDETEISETVSMTLERSDIYLGSIIPIHKKWRDNLIKADLSVLKLVMGYRFGCEYKPALNAAWAA